MAMMVFPLKRLTNRLHIGFLLTCKELALGNAEYYFICLLYQRQN